MEINLLPILNFDGRKITIDEDVKIKEENSDSFSILKPIHFDGFAVNSGGTIELIGKAYTDVRLECDRCTESYGTRIEYEIDERFRKQDEFSDSEQNPDIITFVGTTIDLDEILYTNLYMNLPSKNLCREDCKGLCSVCGKNLNLGDCGCVTENTDPRFDILDKLL